jgi:adenylosuccinate lyase
LLKADPDVAAALSGQEIEDKFNLDYHFAQVDTIFRRVFGEA